MPIWKENMKRYPGGSIRSPEWQAIRERIGQRSGWKCEDCNAPNAEHVCRGKIEGRGVYMIEDGSTFDEDTGEFLGHLHLYDLKHPRWVKIVLTVAHLDDDPGNNADDNLRHLCQLHHNRLDVKSRQKNAAKTRRGKLAGADLFEEAK